MAVLKWTLYGEGYSQTIPYLVGRVLVMIQTRVLLLGGTYRVKLDRMILQLCASIVPSLLN